MKKVFIDGSAGTTGLRIYDRLSQRKDIELVILSEELRKDIKARKEALNSCDIAFLCLPDAAAVEAVSLIENENTVVIDTSTAHRTSPDWVYGFPEFKGMREKIINSKRIANPGCHASGFLSLIKPLVSENILNKEVVVPCFSLTGYSGAGKKVIADYQSENRPALYSAPRQYALGQAHKHLKEMKEVSGLSNMPLFSPIIADFYSGMEVTVMLSSKDIKGNIKNISDIYKEYYNSKIVYFEENPDEDGFLSAMAMSGRDDMSLSVFGNDERIILVSRFDNLGKGASGSAVQNMNLLLGANETEGLVLKEDKNI